MSSQFFFLFLNDTDTKKKIWYPCSKSVGGGSLSTVEASWGSDCCRVILLSATITTTTPQPGKNEESEKTKELIDMKPFENRNICSLRIYRPQNRHLTASF